MRIDAVLDFDLEFLREACRLIDGRLDKLGRDADLHPDPDSFGILDRIEYITGFGFVACQTYITARRGLANVDKRIALRLGPQHRKGHTIVELVNAAANAWKHSGEWSTDNPSNHERLSKQILASLDVDISAPYYLSNVLFEILTPHPRRFESLLPFLKQWSRRLSEELRP